MLGPGGIASVSGILILRPWVGAWLRVGVFVGVSVVDVAIGVKLEFENSGGTGVLDLLATKLTLPVSSWTKSPDSSSDESDVATGCPGNDSVELS